MSKHQERIGRAAQKAKAMLGQHVKELASLYVERKRELGDLCPRVSRPRRQVAGFDRRRSQP